ncbi:MAG: exodeoxyribonuclease VII large subunit [Catenisphaera adipataccumulans]|jgi:exodeoxyribonuclease VII large subunit|uniref:exodeoxyribonuclease VII large subunit n=1 Tax=Catenisphaera adipataccumulans TaxID=700500 RepID=UPI003D8E1E89
MSENLPVVSVSSVLRRLDKVLEKTMPLDTVWIEGEISGLKKYKHYYFSLKDEQGMMACIMYEWNARRLDFDLKDGMKVLVRADISVYHPNGKLQLVIKSVRQSGLGQLYLEFERRKKKLTEAGYFDDAHKKPKPDYMENIAVITSANGEVIHDVRKTIAKRWPMMKITLYPAAVQGDKAAPEIIRQLKKADPVGYDAILIVRGGGSFEDLFCFNDEQLVKAIYDTKTFTVSGVGHEPDFTLCDMVCDVRCATPTAAAEFVSWNQYEVLAGLEKSRQSMVHAMRSRLGQGRRQLEQYKNNPYIRDPMKWAADKQLHLAALQTQMEQEYEHILDKRIDIVRKQELMSEQIRRFLQGRKMDLAQSQQRIPEAMKNYRRQQRDTLKHYAALLDAYSPLKTISRGYTITTKNGQYIRSIQDVDPGDSMETKVKDGTILSTVIKKG